MSTVTGCATVLDRARAAAGRVVDPEMPMLTLADLGVLRAVEVDDEGLVTVSITPTYTGCPAMAAMRDDLVRTLADEGLAATVAVVLSPAWTSDDITPAGRAALAAHGLSTPGPANRQNGPVALNLGPVHRALRCPRCHAAAVELTSEFGPTACTALYRCAACGEPFQHVKEI